jgi:predicted dehydrogenase
MRNWRRHKNLSGPHILEKCCHDIDLINWIVESLPSKVCAFGGNNIFTKENNMIKEKLQVNEFVN